jgi:Lrp/AsnC family transcriptional regulator for asnA, asnC and gidA
VLKVRDIDARILKTLLRDGRTSFTKMAQDNGTTKDRIWKHYNLMEKKGIIVGSTIQMNYDSFGYDAIVTMLIDVEAQQIDKVTDYLSKITEVLAYRQYNSLYNIRAVAILKNLNELDHVKAAIRGRLPTTALRTYVWTAVKNIPENLKLMPYLIPMEKITESCPKLSARSHLFEKPKIDDLDLKIVEKLAINGRTPFNEIAQDLGVSTDTVLKRYHKLKENCAIKVSIQINPNKIGYSSILDFNITFASSSNSSSVIESLIKIPDVIIITKTSGDYDLQLTAMIRNVEQMFSFQEEIARTPGVTKIEVSTRKIPAKWPTPQQHITTF